MQIYRLTLRHFFSILLISVLCLVSITTEAPVRPAAAALVSAVMRTATSNWQLAPSLPRLLQIIRDNVSQIKIYKHQELCRIRLANSSAAF